jgi:hypothetical protein
MNLNFGFFKRGLELKSEKGVFKLDYPKEVWQNFSAERGFFLDNTAYLHTICMPLVSDVVNVRYNTSKPFFRREFDKSVIKDIPSAVEEYKTHTEDVMQKFRRTKRIFAGNNAKKPVFDAETGERAVVPFSCGKDSLLTLAVCDEIGLNPVPVYINDTVSPSENRLKLKFVKKIAKQKKLDFAIVKNEIENINDFEFWDKPEADAGYAHMIIGFCFLSLPLAKFYNAKHIVLGNELDLNDTLVNKDGIRCYPSYDQSFKGTKRLNKLIKKATRSKVGVTSVISPLYDLAIMRVLHKRYPELGKHQSSCPGLDDSREKRWCMKCPDCTRFYVYMKALNLNPRSIGLTKDLLEKRSLKHHTLFNPKKMGRYEKAGENDDTKFAYYLAYKNGARGYVMDLFRKRYFDEIKEKEDKLYKKYFSIHSTKLIPKSMKKDVVSIYKEELSNI